MKVSEVISNYFAGKFTGEEANEYMKEYSYAPKIATDTREIPSQIRKITTANVQNGKLTGFGLMNTGSGCMEKIEVLDGVLSVTGLPNAEFFMGNKIFHVSEDGKTIK